MAVFLVNQCTFTKNCDQQTNPSLSNGDLASNGVVSTGPNGLPTSSNICGLKFDSLFELIQHIEDNHISDIEYSTFNNGQFYNGFHHHHLANQHQVISHHPQNQQLLHHHHGLPNQSQHIPNQQQPQQQHIYSQQHQTQNHDPSTNAVVVDQTSNLQDTTSSQPLTPQQPPQVSTPHPPSAPCTPIPKPMPHIQQLQPGQQHYNMIHNQQRIGTQQINCNQIALNDQKFLGVQPTVMNNGIYNNISGPVIAGQNAGLMNTGPPYRDTSNVYNVIPHDRAHMTQIINGTWLPTSCILRIFNTNPKTQKMMSQQQQQQLHMNNNNIHHPQQIQMQQPMTQQTGQFTPSHQLMQKLQGHQHHIQPTMQLQQQMKYEPAVGINNIQDSQNQANITTHMIATNMRPTHMQGTLMNQVGQPMMQPQQTVMSHPMMQTQPCIQGQTVMVSPSGVHGQPIIQQGTMQVQQSMTPQPGMMQTAQQGVVGVMQTPVSIQSQQGLQSQQPQTIHGQQMMSVQQQASPQIMASVQNVSSQPQQPQQNQQQTKSQPKTQALPQSQPQTITTANNVKLYKCPECSKTYKTMHGLRTHQGNHKNQNNNNNSSNSSSQPNAEAKPTGIVNVSGPIVGSEQNVVIVNSSLGDMSKQPQSAQFAPSHQLMQKLQTPQMQQSVQLQPIKYEPQVVTNQDTTNVITPNQGQIQPQMIALQHPVEAQIPSQTVTGPTTTTTPTLTTASTNNPPATTKVTKIYKCADCSKTYKTMHGLRTHQATHRPNNTAPAPASQSTVKTAAILPDVGGGDNTALTVTTPETLTNQSSRQDSNQQAQAQTQVLQPTTQQQSQPTPQLHEIQEVQPQQDPQPQSESPNQTQLQPETKPQTQPQAQLQQQQS